METGSVQITGNYENGQDILSFTNTSKITGSWTAITGKMTLTRVGGESPTLTEWQDAMRSVTYHNTSENPATSLRTLTFIVNDGELMSNASTRTITVTAVNDAPVITEGNGPIAVTCSEDNSPTPFSLTLQRNRY